MWATGYYTAVDNKTHNRFSYANWGLQMDHYRSSISVITPERWTNILRKGQTLMLAPAAVPGIIELNSDAEAIPDPRAAICEPDTEEEV
jgi:hypothetical protein